LYGGYCFIMSRFCPAIQSTLGLIIDKPVFSSDTQCVPRGSALQIIFFAFPLMLGNLFQMMYNTADTIVVGNFVGKEALAVVGFAYPAGWLSCCCMMTAYWLYRKRTGFFEKA